MEDSQIAQSGNSGKSKIQRYALRSAIKLKEEKEEEKPPASSEFSNSTASKRVRAASSVSKSVSVLDLSGKEKSTKPPRRLSIPAKPAATPALRPVSSITPISEVRGKRSDSIQRITDTPVSDVSRLSSRKKFSVLSSASYWLSQIKLSEAAAKHSVSLGFFKLALEAGCEPLQRVRDELTCYARRHNLSELGDPVKELFESYNIVVESTGQLQVSETCSQVPEEETRSSDDEIRSSSSTVGSRKLKPKASNSDAAKVSAVTGSTTKKNTIQKVNPTSTRTRVSLTKNSANSRSLADTGANKSIKKPQKPIKQELKKERDLTKKKGKKSVDEEGKFKSAILFNIFM
ncbi:hypothetical protein L484_007624 [Morus notabilis]|uniref:Uncharacterized protein n=1 Tax=Morus notabilis TaxID=981085 RepID=W9QW11_9ROSA|nr:hypothetical protein L484_007624 [Morus notabilis]